MLVVGIPCAAVAESYDPLQRKDPPRWSFGEGLNSGDLFEYAICDFALRIPESPDPCYVVTLHFLHLLPSTNGKIWIVSAHIDHNVRQLDTVLHVSAESFAIQTDGTSLQYANSLERTLGWIKNHAQKFKPQVLAVGKSWGFVAADVSQRAELLVIQMDSVSVQDDVVTTYKIGYLLMEESFFHIRDGFPFPIKAIAYKPVSSHQNVPPAFELELLSYSNSGLRCDPRITHPQVPAYFGARSSIDEEDLKSVSSGTIPDGHNTAE